MSLAWVYCKGIVCGVSLDTVSQVLCSASVDGGIKAWDLEHGLEIGTLTTSAWEVNAVAVTADGRRIVSATAYRSIQVNDLILKRRLLVTWNSHIGQIVALVVTPDGRRVVSAAESLPGIFEDVSGNLKLWDLERRKEICTLEGHTASVRAVAMMPHGQRAISASDDSKLKLWDLERGQELFALEGHTTPVRAMAVTLDGQRAVSVSADRTLRTWDLDSGSVVTTFSGEDEMTACAVGPDGVAMVAGEISGRVHILRLEEPDA